MPRTNGQKHCWPTAPNIVECYMLGPFARPCCTLLSVAGSCCPKFETVQTFSYVKTDATTPNDVVGRCYVCLQVVLDTAFYPKVTDNNRANLISKTIFLSAIVETLVQFCYGKFCRPVYEFIILNNNLLQVQRSEDY